MDQCTSSSPMKPAKKTNNCMQFVSLLTKTTDTVLGFKQMSNKLTSISMQANRFNITIIRPTPQSPCKWDKSILKSITSSPENNSKEEHHYCGRRLRLRSRGVNTGRTCSSPVADIWNDHNLVLMSLCLRLKKIRSSKCTRVKTDLDRLWVLRW